MYKDYLISIMDKFEEAVPLIKQDDKVIASRGNIFTITGKAKSYKTFVTSIMVTSFLNGSSLGLSGDGKDGKVLMVDTEQSKYHCWVVLNRIYKMAHRNPEQDYNDIRFMSLRELSPEDRRKCVDEAINEYHPDLIIIDGIRDMIKDFNDLKESSEIVSWLMHLSSAENNSIGLVLHQNKADNNARGHLGTELCNKSETVLQVENSNGIGTISPLFSRNEPIEPFSFQIVDGVPVGCNGADIVRKGQELRTLFEGIMRTNEKIGYKALNAKVVEKTKCSYATAGRKIKDAVESGVLNKEGKTYSLVIMQEMESV